MPLVGTGFAGLVTGGMGYISLVEAPGRSELPAADQLRQWRSTFPRAMGIFKPAGMMLVPALASVAYVAGNPFFYAAAVPFGLLGPFTAATIAPINDRLLTMSEADAASDDGAEVKQLVAQWASRHAVRSAMAFTGFAMCLVAVARQLSRCE